MTVHITYVTAGSVGVGDLMHGLALRRAVERGGLDARVSLVSPPLPFPALKRLQDWWPVEIDHRPLLDPATASETPLGRQLRALQPDLLVVGHFWAPVQHLLLDVEAWLLVRKSPAQWLRGAPGMPFARRRFRRILEMEPVGFALAVDDAGPAIEPWPPIVVVHPDDVEVGTARYADAARAALLAALTNHDAPHACATHDATHDATHEEPLCVVFQAGEAGESAQLRAHAPAGHRYLTIDLRSEHAPWPLAPLLVGADHVVSGAGYNAFWETRVLGLEVRSTLVPFPRRLDDQAWRVRTCTSVPIKKDGADLLARAVVGVGSR